MKIFSIEEANALLPTVRHILKSIQGAHARVRSFSEAVKQAVDGAEHGGGGMFGGERYIRALFRLASSTGLANVFMMTWSGSKPSGIASGGGGTTWAIRWS